jgi:replicative DNA helicase
VQRLAAMETGIDLFDLRDPRNLNATEMHDLTGAVAGISAWPLLVEDSGASPSARLARWQGCSSARARRLFLWITCSACALRAKLTLTA